MTCWVPGDLSIDGGYLWKCTMWGSIFQVLPFPGSITLKELLKISATCQNVFSAVILTIMSFQLSAQLYSGLTERKPELCEGVLCSYSVTVVCGNRLHSCHGTDWLLQPIRLTQPQMSFSMKHWTLWFCLILDFQYTFFTWLCGQ